MPWVRRGPQERGKEKTAKLTRFLYFRRNEGESKGCRGDRKREIVSKREEKKKKANDKDDLSLLNCACTL